MFARGYEDKNNNNNKVDCTRTLLEYFTLIELEVNSILRDIDSVRESVKETGLVNMKQYIAINNEYVEITKSMVDDVGLNMSCTKYCFNKKELKERMLLSMLSRR